VAFELAIATVDRHGVASDGHLVGSEVDRELDVGSLEVHRRPGHLPHPTANLPVELGVELLTHVRIEPSVGSQQSLVLLDQRWEPGADLVRAELRALGLFNTPSCVLLETPTDALTDPTARRVGGLVVAVGCQGCGHTEPLASFLVTQAEAQSREGPAQTGVTERATLDERSGGLENALLER